MIPVNYNVATRSLSIDVSCIPTWGADIAATLNRYGQQVPLRGASFGTTITVNGSETANVQWPTSCSVYRQTDQDVLALTRVKWQPDDAVVIDAWAETPGGRVTASEEFTVPRPVNPFPSWEWDNGRWSAPTPMPDGDWDWDEDAGQWVVNDYNNDV